MRGTGAGGSPRRVPKIRIPSTTTTAVESWLPTPSLSPRKTIRAATTMLDTKDTTNTLATKMPSSRARIPPKTASSSRHDRNRQIRLEPGRHRGVQQDAGHDADDQGQCGDHRGTLVGPVPGAPEFGPEPVGDGVSGWAVIGLA